MCKCNQMKKSREMMSRMFDSSETPVRTEKRYVPPMWYYITTAKGDLMWGQDSHWVENDLQHTIPMIFKSSVRARAFCIKHGISGIAIKGSRFVEIGKVPTNSITWL